MCNHLIINTITAQRWKGGITNDKIYFSEKVGAPDKPCGEAVQMLTQNCCQTIHEEWYVLDSFYLCTEAFYL